MTTRTTARDTVQPLDFTRVRDLDSPALLRSTQNNGLYVWTGNAFHRIDGTIAGVADDGPWTLAAAPVPKLTAMLDRAGGVDSYRFGVYLNTGRDPYHDRRVR